MNDIYDDFFEKYDKEKDKRQKEKKEKTTSLISAVFDWVELFSFALALVLIIMTFVVRHSPVVGASMIPTLEEGDVLIVSDIAYKPKTGDIIIVQLPNKLDEPLVKRVIAVGGDTLEIDFENWRIKVNGKIIEEYGIATDESYKVNYTGKIMSANDLKLIPYYDEKTGIYKKTIDEGKIFVLGDNRNNSLDSRSRTVGEIDERFVVGEVKFRIWPYGKVGAVD